MKIPVPNAMLPEAGMRRASKVRGWGNNQVTQVVMNSENRVESQFRGGVDQLHGLLQTLRQRFGPPVLETEKKPELHRVGD